jgi:hypothetical protein
VALDDASPGGSEAALAPGTQVRELSVVVPHSAVGVLLQVRTPDGRWTDVHARLTPEARGPRLLHARLAAPLTADAVRVVGAHGATLRDLVVLASP